LQWLRDLCDIIGDSLNYVRREDSIHFRNKSKEYLKDKINELGTNSKNKNIGDLYRGINEFKWGHQPRNYLLKDDNDDLLADSHNIFYTGGRSIWQKNALQQFIIIRAIA
jgi:hypothetical protein